MDRLQTDALPGFEPEIGRWLWALEEVRHRTVRLANGIEPHLLDWEGPNGDENAIGSLLYHIALVEMSWLFLDVLGEDHPPAVRADFPHDMGDEHGRMTRVPGVPLATHMDRLARSRAVLLERLRGTSIEEWRRLRRPADSERYEVTPEWAVFHLIEHEAGHAFQISALRGRSLRSA